MKLNGIPISADAELVCELTNYDGLHPEMSIFIRNPKTGVVSQDVCLVRKKEDIDNVVECLVWGDEADEDYTNSFEIKVWIGKEEK